MPYTTPPTAVAGAPLAASDWNTKVRDSIEDVAKPRRARVYRNASQSIPNAASTNVIWTTEEYNTGLWVPGAPDRFTIPAGVLNGYWHIGACIQYSANGAGARYFAILKNGVQGMCAFNSGGSASWFSGSVITAEYYANPGDYFTVLCYQNSGAALNIDAAYPLAFWIHQISR